MKTVVLGERPRQLEEWLARRRELGQDRFDEVWEGEYHVAPAPHPRHGYLEAQLVRRLGERADAAGLVGTGAFNLGEPDDYRVPDHGYHHELPTATYVPTAAVVVEVVSPDDETYEKFGFYAAHGVDELVIVEPQVRRVRLWQLRTGRYEESSSSALLRLTAEELTAELDWPS